MSLLRKISEIGEKLRAAQGMLLSELALCSLAFVLLDFFYCAAPVYAGTRLPNGERIVTYSVVEQDLRDVLAGLGGQLGLRLKISDHVHGKVHGRLPPGSAVELLDRLAGLYDLDWYYNSGTVFVSSHDEIGLKLIGVNSAQLRELSDALEDLDIADGRWPIRASGHGVVLASGPPDYLALVEQTLTALSRRPHDAEVRVVRGSVAGVP